MFSTFFYAQDRRHRRMDGHKKIDQLERLKLMEILELDEETFIRFFARHSEHKSNVRLSMQGQDKKIADMDAIIKSARPITDKEYADILNDYVEGEKKILQDREAYLKSLQAILKPEQVCKLVVFEKKFRDEIRDILLKDRNRKRKDNER